MFDHKLQDEKGTEEQHRAIELESNFPFLKNKEQAWNEMINLIKIITIMSEVRLRTPFVLVIPTFQ